MRLIYHRLKSNFCDECRLNSHQSELLAEHSPHEPAHKPSRQEDPRANTKRQKHENAAAPTTAAASAQGAKRPEKTNKQKKRPKNREQGTNTKHKVLRKASPYSTKGRFYYVHFGQADFEKLFKKDLLRLVISENRCDQCHRKRKRVHFSRNALCPRVLLASVLTLQTAQDSCRSALGISHGTTPEYAQLTKKGSCFGTCIVAQLLPV